MLLLPPLEVPDVLTQGSVFLFPLIPKTISVAIKPQLEGVGCLAQVLLQLTPAGHLSPVDQGLGLAFSLQGTRSFSSSAITLLFGISSPLPSKYLLVMPRDDGLHVGHAAVAQLHIVLVEDLTHLRVSREVLAQDTKESLTNVGLHIGTKRRIQLCPEMMDCMLGMQL